MSRTRHRLRTAAGPFAHRPLLAITVGGTQSVMAAAAAQAVLIWHLQDRASPSQLGAILAAYWGARVVGQMLGGVLADRVSRGRVMVLGDLLCCASTLLIGAWAALMLPLTVLAAVVVGYGLSSQLYQLSSQSALPDLVAEEQLPRANAGVQAAYDGGRVIGSACA